MYPESTTIPLTQGLFATVDAEDAERLSAYRWQAHKSGRKWYAECNTSRQGHRQWFSMHRMLMDAPQGMEVDHRNGDSLDNRKSNLRLCTKAQNRAHKRMEHLNTSGYTGVYFRPRLKSQSKQWVAEIGDLTVGTYHTAEEAARARDARARELHGEFAVLNFPDDTGPVPSQPQRLHGCAKVSVQDVRDIKQRYKPYIVTCAALAKEYGVHEETIRRILKGQHCVLKKS